MFVGRRLRRSVTTRSCRCGCGGGGGGNEEEEEDVVVPSVVVEFRAGLGRSGCRVSSSFDTMEVVVPVVTTSGMEEIDDTAATTGGGGGGRALFPLEDNAAPRRS